MQTKRLLEKHSVKPPNLLILIRVDLKPKCQRSMRLMRFLPIRNCELGLMLVTIPMTRVVVWEGILSLRVVIRLVNSLTVVGSLVVLEVSNSTSMVMLEGGRVIRCFECFLLYYLYIHIFFDIRAVALSVLIALVRHLY